MTDRNSGIAAPFQARDPALAALSLTLASSSFIRGCDKKGFRNNYSVICLQRRLLPNLQRLFCAFKYYVHLYKLRQATLSCCNLKSIFFHTDSSISVKSRYYIIIATIKPCINLMRLTETVDDLTWNLNRKANKRLPGRQACPCSLPGLGRLCFTCAWGHASCAHSKIDHTVNIWKSCKSLKH